MSKRDEKLIVQDIVHNMELILVFTSDMDYTMFEADNKTSYAVDRCFEIVGEATRQLPEAFMLQHTHIEWQKMVAFRNVLIHEYFRVERQIEWNIIKNHLPQLLLKLKKLLTHI
ncbi:MAG: DUF86 domain-containing protein [Chitinophagales bacterium]|jgi:uncharacterized protein with HEPN domain|nr:DUF86 domain-containing protein [Chitinophagales bacterium]